MGSLRLLLALSVVIAHAKPFYGIKLMTGLEAVQSFFIISGFYMALILNEKYVGKGSYKLFISNRILRLMPTYWAILFISAVCTNLYLKTWINNFGDFSITSQIYMIFTSLFLLGQDIGMFLQIDTNSGSLVFLKNLYKPLPEHIPVYKFLFIPQSWTLGIELSFYFIAPFIVRKKIALVMILLAVSLALRGYLFSIGYESDPWTYRLFPIELALFLIGVLSYRLYKGLNKVKDNPGTKEWIKVFNIILICLLVVAAFAYQYIPTGIIADITNIRWLNPINKKWLYYLLVFISIPFLFNLTKRNRIDNFIGQLSYPVYLIHYLITRKFFFPVVNYSGKEWTNVAVGVYIVIVLVFSIGLVLLLEKPIENLRRRRFERAKGLSPN